MSGPIGLGETDWCIACAAFRRFFKREDGEVVCQDCGEPWFDPEDREED